jgi:tRNA (guanine26-N2/guanine27-N2)-dimethyltransferase
MSHIVDVNMDWRQEGQAIFQIGQAFYRPEAQLARDLGTLAAAVDRVNQGHLRVLEAMAGCGVRSLRYGLESKADWLWVNDADPDLAPILQANLARNLTRDRYQLTHWHGDRLLAHCYDRQTAYDLVDWDGFGSPAPYLATLLGAVRVGGLLYLTSTDGRIISGRYPKESLRLYGTYARSHPSVQEQALRILIGALFRQAIARGLSLKPVFSLFKGQTYRIMVRVEDQAPDLHAWGFLSYCHTCGQYQAVGWGQLGRVRCPAHPSDGTPVVSGPLWLGELHDPAHLAPMLTLAQTWNWVHVAGFIQTMLTEATLPPYHIPMGELGRRGQMDIPPRDRLIAQLIKSGFRASATHINPQAIKTDAAIATCLEIARQCLP